MLPIICFAQFLEHNTGYRYPEKPERLTAVVNALKTAKFADKITWLSPTPTIARNLQFFLQQLHSLDYISQLQAIARQDGGNFYNDTIISPLSAWLDGVDQVLAQKVPVFVLSPPSGHHALKNTGIDFCLFANTGIDIW